MARLPRPERKRFDPRASAARRGYNGRHRNWRKLVLARDPICRGCQAAPSVLAEHIVPLNDGGSWRLENGQGCCLSCGNWKSWKEQRDPHFGRRLLAAGVPKGWRRMTI
jgi:hypothetical protein